MSIALVVGLSVVLAVVLLAHRQPWLGVKLSPSPAGKGVIVTRAEGPSAHVSRDVEIVRIASATDSLVLEPFDLTIEPDGSMGDYPTYERFLSRQSRLARIQGSPAITLTSADEREFIVIPDRLGRPFADLPADFWVQLVVGLTAWLVSAAVHAFRPRDAAARYLLLSGAATLLFSPAAAVYTTRELAVDGTVFRWASDLNFFGGSVFTASFIALLLHYPRRLAPAWVGITVTGVYVVWFLLQQSGVFESMTFARRFLVMLGVGLTFILAGIHWVKTGKDPVARAALQWFLLSWMLGTCLFAAFILLPQMFGVDTSALQGYAFLLFLLVYGGLAFGILRYRLFELGDWWRRLAGWTLAVVVLVLLDMLFLFGLGWSTGTSLTVSLAVCGLVWLPFRAWIWGRLVKKQDRHHGELFRRAMDVALAPKAAEQTARWEALLASVFDPLEIRKEPGGGASVTIGSSGLSMTVPAVGRIPAVCLEFAKGGASLFSPHDAALAGELVEMLSHTMESRSAYENGVNEERGRIARDIHDNIGAQLLAALHSGNLESKDSKIRETLSDLRDVINNTSARELSMDEILADLRMETSERLAEVGILLKWSSAEFCDASPGASVMHALRSMVREAVTNVIRHSGAREACLSFRLSAGELRVEIADDGSGFHPGQANAGNGLENLRSRLDRLKGTLEISGNHPGTRLSIRIPVPGKTPGRERSIDR